MAPSRAHYGMYADQSAPPEFARATTSRPYDEEALATLYPYKVAVGSSVGPAGDLMVGWEDTLTDKMSQVRDMRYPDALAPKSQIGILPSQYVFIRAYPHSYACDALSPLELEFAFRDLVSHGVQLSTSNNLGPGGQKALDLTFHLHRPPQFWVRVNGQRRRGTDRDLLLDGGYEADGVPRFDRGFKGVSVLGEKSVLRLGRWLSYRFSFVESQLPQLREALKISGLLPKIPPLVLSRMANPRVAHLALLDRQFPSPLADFHLKYAIDGLISFGIIGHHQVDELIGLVADLKTPDGFQDSVRAQRILATFFRCTRIWDVKAEVENVKDKILQRPMRAPSAHMALVGKVVVTPTRILLYPPEPQTSNFVLRRFPVQTAQGRFIRVQFWDEGNRLHMLYHSKADETDQMEGIVARCLCSFLAPFQALPDEDPQSDEFWITASSLLGGDIYPSTLAHPKNGSFWAISEDKEAGFTRGSVRRFLGDFEKELIVAKNSARRGQLYSTTRDVGKVGRVLRIPDFETKDGRYMYSDGVGICTPALAHKAARVLGAQEEAVQWTSAIQFRQGGAKGVAVAWPPRPRNAEGVPLFPKLPWPNLRGCDMLVRNSQVKFDSAHADLGVIKTSVYSFGYLNREVLTILYPRGIRHADIMDMFEAEIEEIVGTEPNFLDGKGLPITNLIDAGFECEPFVRALARLFTNRALWELKWKARVFVEQGVNGLGVLDELGVLEEHQVYCRTIDPLGNEHTVTGKCIIFRAPTRHPGDVQIVEAVDHPALRLAGLVNVIVFPRRGDRDLASKLGGGDLDGDDYTLFWDPRLTCIREMPAMEYEPTTPPVRCTEKVQPKQTREFHTQYMKRDTLGAISNAHLAMADMHGPDHPDVIALAELHSTAVDFAKTGVPAILPYDLRPEFYPDFMGERRNGRVYESKKPLGYMFRHHRLTPFPPLEPIQDTYLDKRFQSVKIPDSIDAEARRLKEAYDLELLSLMTKFDAREEEVVAGVVLELPGGLKRLDKDNKLRDPLIMAMATIRLDYLDEVQRLATASPPLPIGEYTYVELFAIASYRITHEQAVVQPDAKKRMLSFPWIFHAILLRFARTVNESSSSPGGSSTSA